MGKHRQEPVKCSVCDGRGEVKIYHDGTYEWARCDACNGKGTQP